MTALFSIGDLAAEGYAKLRDSGIDLPGTEAQLLLAWALGTTRLDVMANPERCLDSAQIGKFRDAVLQRSRRVPLAYIRGTQEFYGFEFAVSPAVLIPRPETELLVEFTLEKSHSGDSSVWDVGTGSGCIAVAISARNPRSRVIASDVSKDALDIASRNAVRHDARVRFIQTDLLSSARAESVTTIVSNPPYIGLRELETLQPEVRDHEPHLALAAVDDGLFILRRLIPQGFRALKCGGWMAVEVGIGQAEHVFADFESSGFRDVGTIKDLAGIDRVVKGHKV